MEENRSHYSLREKTMLQDRYRIDSVLGYNGLTITYEAFDTFREQKIVIKELFPSAIAERRAEDQKTVSCIRMIHEKEFRQLKERLIKEAKTLISMYPLEGIANVLNQFEENQTVYVVSEYIQGITLTEYFDKLHMPYMQVKDVIRLLRPIAASLDKLHKKGVIHGKINPEVIRIKGRKTALVGFCDPMEDSSLPVFENATARIPEFAPMELYIENGILDAATDSYSLAAVIYRMVTGQPALPFYERVGDREDFVDPLIPPRRYNNGLMIYQNDAIVKALNVYQESRYATAAELLAELSEDEFAEESKIIMHKKPKSFAKKYRDIRFVRFAAAAGILFLLLFFGPKACRYAQTAGAKHFFVKIEEADITEQCRMIVELSDKKRSLYANDYNKMEEPDISGNSDTEYVIHYYDKITKRFVTYDQIDMDAGLVRYSKLDYRRNNTAILTFYDENGARQLTVNLKPDLFGIYTVEEVVIPKNGESTRSIQKVSIK